MTRTLLLLSGVLGFTGVALGAFGAHALKTRLPPDLFAVFQTGVQYHLIHAVALLGVAVWLGRGATGAATWAGWLFVVGVVLFSGSLYALALSGVRVLGAITPLGGVAFLAGWVALIVEAWRTRG